MLVPAQRCGPGPQASPPCWGHSPGNPWSPLGPFGPLSPTAPEGPVLPMSPGSPLGPAAQSGHRLVCVSGEGHVAATRCRHCGYLSLPGRRTRLAGPGAPGPPPILWSPGVLGLLHSRRRLCCQAGQPAQGAPGGLGSLWRQSGESKFRQGSGAPPPTATWESPTREPPGESAALSRGNSVKKLVTYNFPC